MGLDAIKELRWATKETVRAIGRLIAALVATERRLWLNVIDVVERLQEAKKHAVAKN